MHAQHDRHRGWNPFWAALGAALLVLVPLVGGTVLLSRQQLSRQRRPGASRAWRYSSRGRATA